MKNKTVLIGVLALIVLLLIGGYLLFFAKQAAPPRSPLPAQEEETVETVLPQDIGLEFTLRPDMKAAKFTMQAQGITSVEYQISYTKEVNGEEVPEALIGEARPTTGNDVIGIDYREFGTCSAKVCRYDRVVSDVTLILKITKTDGKILQAETTLTL